MDIKFVSSNGVSIKNLNYTCERVEQGLYFFGMVLFYGDISFYSSKEIDANRPFSASMIDVSGNCSINIEEIWLTEFHKVFQSDNIMYEAKFQAEYIRRGNIKSAYKALLKKG